MNVFGSFVIAFSMYSRIPMPQVEWTKERMRYAMCFFPLIGLVIGAVQLLLFRLLLRLEAGELFRACAVTAVPLLMTGGIHMDGYLDVTDARRSYGSREKKLEILKDPHTGAFAIIGLGVYLLLYTAAASELRGEEMELLAAVYVMERSLSGFSVVAFPKAKKEGLAAQFSGEARQRAVMAAMLFFALLSAGAILWLGRMEGLVLILAAGLTFFLYYRMAMREFGGMTGDLAGHFLQSCELAAVLSLAFCRLAGV